ncbi:patched domain-containing protein 3-like [Watersipora subatra]|uniref:patched domain-containing protein 3-like n=1 Tax=Watersipora subatra TaxID=2589382 RepID=UPI00355BCAAA
MDEKDAAETETSSKQPELKKENCIYRTAAVVSEGLERFFYNLGYAVASRPWTVILATILITTLFGLGMFRFELKDSSAPIWIPSNSENLEQQRWVEEMFPTKYRYNMLLITAENVLEPAVLKQMLEYDILVKELTELNNSESDLYNFNWTSICIRLSGQCLSNSILELWDFDAEAIGKLERVEEVIEKIASTSVSPVTKMKFVPTNLFGEITYDQDDRIVGAKATKMMYIIEATTTNELDTKVVGPDLLWEKKFIDLAVNLDKEKKDPIKGIDVSAVRSFRDESDKSFHSDVTLLMVGVGLIISYVAIILGKFNELEHKVYLALFGVFGIGLASLASYGSASVIGMFYGPIHPILPFLLLGLGVDDMFVIVEAWNNLNTYQKTCELKVKIAFTMQHAGVSITVTSLTDFVAFAIGATTTLPALRSFCVYAALGILCLFIIQSTFFVACLTIDQRRQDTSRDACCIWIKYTSFEPNRCSQRVFLPWFLRKFVAPFLITLPMKVFVLSLTVCLLALSTYGTYLLKTDSDLSWFLPIDSYLKRFFHTQDKYFDKLLAANLYIGDIDYFNSRYELSNITRELEQSRYIRGEVIGWHNGFSTWLSTQEAANAAYYYGESLSDTYPETKEGFYKLLNAYVVRSGQQYYESLQWNDSNPRNYRILKASKVSLLVNDFASSEDDTASLSFFEELTNRYFPDKAFIWSINFRNLVTNRTIQKELYLNLGLAFIAVFIVTLILVVDIITCTLVCMCVIFTLVNVCGFMHFWGLTIDTLTSILLILSIGLAIDYSAHVGHTFRTIAGTRDVRARRTITTIGPAVVNGGFSTFLAIVLLSTSNSYVFITFFKVFFLVVTFGLFQGICVLPVILSWFGPPAYIFARSGVALTSAEATHVSLAAPPHTLKREPAQMKGAEDVVSLHAETAASNRHETTVLDRNYIEMTIAKPSQVEQTTLANFSFLEAVNSVEKLGTGLAVEQPLTCDKIILDCEEYLHIEQSNELS